MGRGLSGYKKKVNQCNQMMIRTCENIINFFIFLSTAARIGFLFFVIQLVGFFAILSYGFLSFKNLVHDFKN